MRYADLSIFCIFLLAMLLICRSSDDNMSMVPDQDDDDDTGLSSKNTETVKMFNFASHAAGAVVINFSPDSSKGYHNLLNDDRDKYATAPCNEKKWVVIGLSEDVLVSTVIVANYEKFSSKLKVFYHILRIA